MVNPNSEVGGAPAPGVRRRADNGTTSRSRPSLHRHRICSEFAQNGIGDDRKGGSSEWRLLKGMFRWFFPVAFHAHFGARCGEQAKVFGPATTARKSRTAGSRRTAASARIGCATARVGNGVADRTDDGKCRVETGWFATFPSLESPHICPMVNGGWIAIFLPHPCLN